MALPTRTITLGYTVHPDRATWFEFNQHAISSEDMRSARMLLLSDDSSDNAELRRDRGISSVSVGQRRDQGRWRCRRPSCRNRLHATLPSILFWPINQTGYRERSL